VIRIEITGERVVIEICRDQRLFVTAQHPMAISLSGGAHRQSANPAEAVNCYSFTQGSPSFVTPPAASTAAWHTRLGLFCSSFVVFLAYRSFTKTRTRKSSRAT
jgi:hypothetical protein